MVLIDREKCVGCGQCVKDCVAGILKVEDGCAVVNANTCIECGHCYAVCPTEAVSIPDMQPGGGEFVPFTDIDSDILLQAMKSRRSVRQFQNREVEEEKIQKILEAGRFCPTGSNSQNIHYTILGSKQDEIESICVDFFRKGAQSANKVFDFAKRFHIDDHFFFKGAPLVIVVSGKGHVDAALASSYMEIMANSLGLGVLYSGFFVMCSKMVWKVAKRLNLPKGYKAVTCMVIGYPAVSYRRIPGRKPLKVTKL